MLEKTFAREGDKQLLCNMGRIRNNMMPLEMAVSVPVAVTKYLTNSDIRKEGV